MKQQTQKREYSFGLKANRSIFRKGMVDGIPIAMGYLAVSFSLGILAKKAGLGPFESFLASILNNASAGEYAAFSLIDECRFKPENQAGGIDMSSSGCCI